MTDTTWIKLMKLGQYLGCHQMPERSFFYKKYQFPVCARCTGVIISSLFTAPLFFIKRLNIYVATLMSSVMLCDWLIQYLGIKESTNNRRFITGLIGGVGWTTIHMYLYYFTFKYFTKNKKKCSWC